MGATGIVASLEGLALVIVLFALADGDAEFNVASAGQDFQRNDGPALLLGVYQGFDFAAFGEEAARAGSVGFDDRNAAGSGDCGIDEVQLVVFDRHVGSAELAVAHPERFGLGAGQFQTHHQRIAELIIMSSAAVGDAFGLAGFLLGHKSKYATTCAKKLLLGGEFLPGDVPERGVVEDLGAVVPVFSAPEVDIAHAGGAAILETVFQPLGIERFVLLGQAGLGDGLLVGRPGFGLELVDHHVAVVDDFLQAGQEAVEPGRIRVFEIAMGDAGVPDTLINGYAELVRLRLAERQAEGVVAAADDDRVPRVQLFDEIIFADQTVAALSVRAAVAKAEQEIFVFQLVAD